MTWEYALIGLLVGIIIGAIAMRFSNRKLRHQQTLQQELEKSKTELDEYREELTGYLASSAELLDNMADNYRNLYQHIAKSSNSLISKQRRENNQFYYNLTKAETDGDQIPTEIQPRDYPESTSGLLRTKIGFLK